MFNQVWKKELICCYVSAASCTAIFLFSAHKFRLIFFNGKEKRQNYPQPHLPLLLVAVLRLFAAFCSYLLNIITNKFIIPTRGLIWIEVQRNEAPVYFFTFSEYLNISWNSPYFINTSHWSLVRCILLVYNKETIDEYDFPKIPHSWF